MLLLSLLCHTRHCCVVFVSFLPLPCRYCHCYVTSVIAVSFLSLFCHSSHHCVVIVVSVLFPSSLCRFFIDVSFPSLLCRCVIVLSFLCNFCVWLIAESLLEDRKLQMTHRRMRPFQNKVLDINIRTHKGLEKDAYFTGEYKTADIFRSIPSSGHQRTESIYNQTTCCARFMLSNTQRPSYYKQTIRCARFMFSNTQRP